MIKRKKTEGFNLAFLDIMSCGLGAIILVFMLVKHNINNSSIELDNLENDIQNLETIKQNSLQTLKSIEQALTENAIQEGSAKAKLEQMQSTLNRTSSYIAVTANKIESLKSEIKNIKVVKKADLIKTEPLNEENYLMGLQVKGQKIALLIDSSASMTHEKLIDIIKTKNNTNRNKQQAKKWRRAKKVLQWLLARLPKNSDVIVVAFNEKARILGKQGWVKANALTSLSTILSDLNRIIPQGATNLQRGLQTINKYAPSHLYIITDGLPTKGESRYKNLNPFASCSSLLGRSSTISGACRIKLFQQTIAESSNRGVQVNVILLPLEGDPDATYQYWNWTAATGGLVLSPASNWP